MSKADDVVKTAHGWVGRPFRPGVPAQCAYFVREVFSEAGLTLPVAAHPDDRQSSGAGYADGFAGDEIGPRVQDLQPGDLVMFANTYGTYRKGTITHVGIYVGAGQMVDRPTASEPVQLRPVSTFQLAEARRPLVLSATPAPSTPATVTPPPAAPAAPATPAPASTPPVPAAAAPGPATAGWRLIAPAEDWQHPIPITAADLPLLEQVAQRMGLQFTRDDAQTKAYIGTHKSSSLKSGPLILPIAGATRANDGAYAADTGVDILTPLGTPVIAAGAGTIVYSEHGHTPWTTPPDTPNSILIKLDTPVTIGGITCPFTWYTHLSRLKFQVPDDGRGGPHVAQGDPIGWSGIGNSVAHLHFGVVQDRAQTVYVPPLVLAAYFGWT